MAESIREWIDSTHPDMLFADGHDASIVGVLLRPSSPPVVLYDGDRVVNGLVERHGMQWEEAEEFAQFNVFSAYVGKETPLFVRWMGGVHA